MSWAKVDDGWPHHPKAIAVGPLGRDLFICALCFCRRHLTDGFIPEHVLPYLAPGLPRPHRVADRLVEARLWERVEGGFRVHNYLKWNDNAAEIQERHEAEKRRKRAWWSRVHGCAASARLDASSDVTLDASSARPLDAPQPNPTHPISKKREHTAAAPPRAAEGEAQKGETLALAARFEAFWRAYPRHEAKQAALRAWRRLAPGPELLERMLAAIAEQRRWRQWREGKIPHAATWLNGRRWEDEPPPDAYAANGHRPGLRTAGNEAALAEAGERLRRLFPPEVAP